MGEKGSKLKVLVDARKLKDGGIGQYIFTIVDELVGSPILSRAVEVTLLVTPRAELPRHWAGLVHVTETAISPYSLAEQFRLGRTINKLPVDVVHIPHFTVPLGLSKPLVVTIHDLIQIKFPERWYYPLVAKVLVSSALRDAERVIVVSEATKRDVLGLAGSAAKLAPKLRVIPNAVDPFFCEPEGFDSGQPLIDGPAPAFLAVYSNSKPHKGVPLLLKAFSRFCEKGLEGTLHLVGRGAGDRATMHELSLFPSDIRSRVIVHGEVSKEALRSLYRGASALVVSSQWEGFCLPVIEAHACSLPVVTTPVPAVLELVMSGDAVVHDFDPDNLANALAQFVGLKSKRRFDMSQWRRESVISRLVEEYFHVAEQILPGGHSRSTSEGQAGAA